METFLSIHQNSILGSLTTFDRMILKGLTTMLYPNGAFARMLSRQGVLLKDFKPYVEGVCKQIKQHAEELAQQAGRSFKGSASVKPKKRPDGWRAKYIIKRNSINRDLCAKLYPQPAFSNQETKQTCTRTFRSDLLSPDCQIARTCFDL